MLTLNTSLWMGNKCHTMIHRWICFTKYGVLGLRLDFYLVGVIVLLLWYKWNSHRSMTLGDLRFLCLCSVVNTGSIQKFKCLCPHTFWNSPLFQFNPTFTETPRERALTVTSTTKQMQCTQRLPITFLSLFQILWNQSSKLSSAMMLYWSRGSTTHTQQWSHTTGLWLGPWDSNLTSCNRLISQGGGGDRIYSKRGQIQICMKHVSYFS